MQQQMFMHPVPQTPMQQPQQMTAGSIQHSGQDVTVMPQQPDHANPATIKEPKGSTTLSPAQPSPSLVNSEAIEGLKEELEGKFQESE